MQIVDRGILFDATVQPPEARVNAFTGLRRLRSGTIIAGFQCGPAKHATTSTARLCRSTDNGRTWTDLGTPLTTTLGGVPGSLSSGDVVEIEPGRLRLFTTWFDRSDPDRPLFDPVTQGILHGRQVWAESTDEGRTWSEWNILPTPGLTGCATTGSPVLWPDGTLGYAFESYKEYDDLTPGRHAAWLAVSQDGGRTFPDFHRVAVDPAHEILYWDQRVCTGREPGGYIALFWTHNVTEQKDLTVHLRQGSIYDSPADERITDTGISGQISAPLLLADGRLLAFVVDRHRPGTLKLWVSHDGGLTWPMSEALLVHRHDEQARLAQTGEQVDFNEYWDDMVKWTFGHPAITLLDGGEVLVAYYAGQPGTLSIHWARIST